MKSLQSLLAAPRPDAARVARWFRKPENKPPPSMYDGNSFGATLREDTAMHLDHLVPVRVLSRRLVEGSLRVSDIPDVLVTVLIDDVGHKLISADDAPQRPSSKRLFEAMMKCDVEQLVPVASLRYSKFGDLCESSGQPWPRGRKAALLSRAVRKFDLQDLA